MRVKVVVATATATAAESNQTPNPAQTKKATQDVIGGLDVLLQLDGPTLGLVLRYGVGKRLDALAARRKAEGIGA